MNIIVAANSDWGIGFEGKQTIVIPEDRSFFKKVTDGGVVIAGRKTYESIGKPLPNRKNIVLTRDMSFSAADVIVAHTVDEVLAEIAGEDPQKVFVIGGGEIYKLFLPMCDLAYVTWIKEKTEADTFFPNLDAMSGWSLERRSIPYKSGGIEYYIYIYRYQEAVSGMTGMRG